MSQTSPAASTAAIRGDAGGELSRPGRRRAMSVLVVAQMLYYFGISIDLTLTGLVGYKLAPTPALATLPFALISVGSWAATYPASVFMRRYGRKAGFLTGSAAAIVGGVASVTALYTRQFALFCVGVGLIGVYQAFAGYYRYAAADLFPAPQRGRAISTVLSGGVIAAVVGPFLATAVKDTLSVEFAGAYALVTVLALVSAGVLGLLRAGEPGRTAQHPQPDGDGEAELERRPLSVIARQWVFVTGVLGAGVGNFVMTLLMTAAPIAAVHAGRTIGQGANVMQWHMVGMYATAFVAGPLTRRFGASGTLLLGGLVSTAGAGIATSSLSVTAFMSALALVGIGWNLMYVSGSALIASSYRLSERAAAQGVGEIFTLGGAAVGSLVAGPLVSALGWRPMAAWMLPLLAVSVLSTCGHLAASLRGKGR